MQVTEICFIVHFEFIPKSEKIIPLKISKLKMENKETRDIEWHSNFSLREKIYSIWRCRDHQNHSNQWGKVNYQIHCKNSSKDVLKNQIYFQMEKKAREAKDSWLYIKWIQACYIRFIYRGSQETSLTVLNEPQGYPIELNGTPIFHY